jgi:hypothetical protein
VTAPNPTQADFDADGMGDACDDSDGDSNRPPGYAECKGPCPGGYNRDSVELYLAISPTDRCADTNMASDEDDDKWPPDYNDDRSVNVLDFTRWKAYFPDAAPLNSVAARRSDLNGSGSVDSLDFAVWKTYFTTACSP